MFLILGALAAIAIPAFLGQRSKANDSKAKAEVRLMATTIETCRTENAGATFAGCDITRLRQIESTIPADADVPLFGAGSYVVQSSPADDTENLFRIIKVEGQTSRDCTLGAPAEAGGCNIGSQEAAEGVDGTW